jgi:hypothetical protein
MSYQIFSGDDLYQIRPKNGYAIETSNMKENESETILETVIS